MRYGVVFPQTESGNDVQAIGTAGKGRCGGDGEQ